MRRVKWLSCFVVAALLPVVAPASLAGDDPAATVTMSQSVPYGEETGAIAAVRKECQLETRLPEFIRSAAKKSPEVILTADPIDDVRGRVLDLKIVGVSGLSGGAWSGPKSITVKGELKEDGKVIGSFTAARYSGGGAWGAYKSTCAIFGRCVKAIGQDIADWLKKPTMNASLGDA